ncbi:uncharacterized protein LOC131944810 [Physella acuta]|uniref:uncharacterized protein LOC131944810 n=1 Tax=Physella acuta TaxID=109671 RepID=UPI0027DB541D|nr:uncharacterized protein LOC131944810 [Physella acuta]
MTVISKTYFALIPKFERQLKIDALMLKKHQKESSPKEILNVMIVGYDGVSRHHFLRAMNKTYSFLMNDLQSFDFTMHTQVGENTFPNFLSLLSGKSKDEVSEWWSRSEFSDAFDLIWRDYKRAGYQTLYTEDWPAIGGFHHAKLGFLFPPTTYYSHPINLAIDADHDMHLTGRDCLGSKPELFFHMDYIKRFFDTFPDWPKFAMTFLTRMTHDTLNDLKKVDDHTYNIYNTLFKEGYLNRTVLISFSDHGQRWGPIRPTFNGMIESRTPYTILTFPKWFLEKYPDVVRNLKTNTARLTTHYDTHATLQELLYFKAKGHAPLKTGHRISLFQVIPKNRTCNDSHIPPEFCVCGQDSVEILDVKCYLSLLLTTHVMKAINSKLDKYLCMSLTLDKIIQVALIQIGPKTLNKDFNDRALFKIRLQTKPGLAIYEATVYTKGNLPGLPANATEANLTPLQVEVGDSIDRLNLYRGQADCVNDARVKLFCYCKDVFERESQKATKSRK